jgi:hypothetical protein
MTRTVAEWLMIGAFVVVVLTALAGCATPGPYLCVAGRLENGTPAMLCKPIKERTP